MLRVLQIGKDQSSAKFERSGFGDAALEVRAGGDAGPALAEALGLLVALEPAVDAGLGQGWGVLMRCMSRMTSARVYQQRCGLG
jgi:hypothetical protein